MNSVFVHIKAIVQMEDSFLVLRHWVDDRIVDPYSWEFIDTEMEPGESPEQAALRVILENTGVEGRIVRPLYTWTNMLGERQCVGIAFLARLCEENPTIAVGEEYCGYEWIKMDELDDYIDNKYVVRDIKNSMQSV